jgi:hypothetical protein
LIVGCGRSSKEKELEAEVEKVLLEVVKRKMKHPSTKIQEEEVAP